MREGKGEKRRGERGTEGAGGGRGGRKGRDEGKGKGRVGRGSCCPTPSHITCLRYAPASIAAAEKRPLSYQTQSVHMVRNCGAQTSPLTMHYGGQKLGENRGRNGRIFTPTKRFLLLGFRFMV